VRLLAPSALDDVDLDTLYGGPRPRVEGRPWVGVCMIASSDGAAAVDGLSGGLGNAGDRAVFGALRRAADLILVGAKTAATERYGPPSKPGQRIGVVTASGRVDTATALFTSGSGFLVIPEDAAEPAADVDVVRAGTGGVDLAAALGRLGELAPEARFVQVEGGPRLNGALLDSGCVDELDLTIAPLLVGGAAGRIVTGAGEGRRAFELAHAATDDDGYLFTRWVRRDPAC
jgi:riboflavin biosynthesis pyrimidine reductase